MQHNKRDNSMKTNRINTLNHLTMYILFFIIFICSNKFIGQELQVEKVKFKIALIGRSYGDSIYLRWAVVNPAAWRYIKQEGVVIERATKTKNGKPDKFIPLQNYPIKPWSLEKWEEYFAFKIKDDPNKLDYDEIAFSLGIGEEDSEENRINPPKEEEDILKSIKQKKSAQDWNLLLMLIAVNNNLKAAEGLGLFFIDKNTKEGETYIYRIYSPFKSQIYEFDTTFLEIKNEKFDPNKLAQKLESIEKDGSIEIVWNIDAQFSTYDVDRSEDGKNFERITKAPQLTLKSSYLENLGKDSYLDTSIINYKTYYYRVYANTVFADKIFLGEVKAMGRDRTPPEQPFLPQPKHISDKAIKITWEISDNTAEDLAGFYVGRDTIPDGSFKKIHEKPLPKNVREYIDTSFSLYNYNFYKVFAFDTAGNISYSNLAYVVLNDTIPPSPPKWKKATIDSNGVVILELLPNKEFDLMGYRILKANAPDHEFSSIIESFDPDSVELRNKTIFIDTVSLNTTTRYVYYRATALDNRYNESDFSETIAVKRPDKVPPIVPIFYQVLVSDRNLTLKFYPSKSEDVAQHIVLRKKAAVEKWDTIAILGPKDSIYVDENAEQNILYNYAIFAKDSSGFSSDLSFIHYARRYFSGILPQFKNFIVEYVPELKKVKLKWDYENFEDVYFVIFRSYESNNLRRYKIVKESRIREIYDDDFLFGDGTYSYAIKAFDRYNSESNLSEVKKIIVKR